MKKLVSISILLLILITAKSQIKYGTKAGSTFCWYESTTDEGFVPDYHTLAGFQVGGFIEISLSKYISLQPEILFSTRGAKVKTNYTYTQTGSSGYIEIHEKTNTTFSPNYLDIPIQIKINFASVSSDKLSIGIGPLFSYGMGGKMSINGSINQNNISGEVKLFSKDRLILKDQDNNIIAEETSTSTVFKQFDIGLSCFIGYEINNHILCSLGYQVGLKNINKDPDEEIRNRCLTLTIGYKL